MTAPQSRCLHHNEPLMYEGREYVIGEAVTDVLPVASGEPLYMIEGRPNILYGDGASGRSQRPARAFAASRWGFASMNALKPSNDGLPFVLSAAHRGYFDRMIAATLSSGI